MKLWIDGSGWNGNKSRAMICLENKIVCRIETTEEKTNNEMEYKALIEALNYCLVNSISNPVIYTDSQLIVGQVTKGWKIKAEHLYPLVAFAKQLVEKVKASIVWIPRNENKAGHLLEGTKSDRRAGE